MSENLKWYEKEGPCGDVVLSTRVRLARNLKEYPFPARASAAQRKEIEEKVKDALLSRSSVLSAQFRFVPMESLTDDQAVSLVERHMVSPEFISGRQGKGLLLSSDESVSIMINEEDHLRIQVMGEGLSLKETAETADRIDTLLGEALGYAFDSDLGYLTQCPTNLGTGMRASVMLHLPALTEGGTIGRMAANLSKLGLTLRGSYGEGSQVTGNLYQLSNQITLGISEKEAIDNLAAITGQLIQEERKARSRLCENILVQDKISRAAGLLQRAKMLSTEEFDKLLSYLRFGLSTGLVKGVTPAQLNALSAAVQPATLMAAHSGQALDQTGRDILRAQMTKNVCRSVTTE